MIKYEKFTLANGLRVLVHEDHSTPLACINILYDVGARDENPSMTGFAHLFEHLMFGGSINIPSYDTPLQQVGGENNAFTNNDITNYYLSLPADNLETGFWLESDRMLSLAFSEKSLEVQRNVVVEEFKQRYLNQPYGDEWLLLRPLAYKKHPYRWATIGEEISHIENARMEDVKAFFKKHYHPSNAILVVSGDVKTDQVKALCEKWFAPIPAGEKNKREIPVEPEQTEARTLEVFRDVPADSLTRVYHMCGRTNELYHTQDLLSDVLGRGSSSRLYTALVKEKQLFSSISAYVTGNIDPGLLVIQGKVNPGVDIHQADEAVTAVINNLLTQGITDKELEKVKNKAESTLVFEEMSILNKAMGLAFAELLGDSELVNTEIGKIRKVSAEQVMSQAKAILSPENCSTLFYRKKV
ncbi:MAG: insulinase family protein [Bacteroidetes bacterium]|nr:insulinase family protein [Bacteroidota bacterium]